MNTSFKWPVALLFLAFTTAAFSQKIVKLEGDLSFLNGQKELNVVYDYSDMAVGEFDSEEDYVNKKVGEYNEKEPGRGDKWKESWESSRERVYHPKFEELFNKYAAKAGIDITTGREDAKYTLIVKTVFTEPGWNIGISSRPSAVSFEYIFVETGTDKVVAKYSQKNVPGAQAMGMDYDTSTRISESYAKAGKMLGAFISKNAGK